ncbi:MAG: type II toxin-antitoxin system HicA family toxin [Bacteroidales bacterium]|nr:type II toxin-antitoxin system HicA family toxin [Bacteroidales bacterium]
MKYSELERKLRRAGCYLIGNNDHPIWYSPITGRTFVTGHHDSHEVNPNTLNKILKQSGLK